MEQEDIDFLDIYWTDDPHDDCTHWIFGLNKEDDT